MNLKVPKLCFTRKEEPVQRPAYPCKSSQLALVTRYFVSRERHLWYFLLRVSISFSLAKLECSCRAWKWFLKRRQNQPLSTNPPRNTGVDGRVSLDTGISTHGPMKVSETISLLVNKGWCRYSWLHFSKRPGNRCVSLCFSGAQGCRTPRVVEPPGS